MTSRRSFQPVGKTGSGRAVGNRARPIIEYRQIADLKPNPKNPRRHSDRQIKLLMTNIERFGFVAPVLIDAKNNILAGHGRIDATQRLGWSEAPTIRLDHLSEAEARALMIADNRLAEMSTWDDVFLAEALKELSGLDLTFDLDELGFDVADIDLRIASLDQTKAEPKQDPDDIVPEVTNGPAITQPGDIWQAGRHRLLCGSAVDPRSYVALLDGKLADIVVTDPPYNVKVDGHVSGKGAVRHREFAMASGEMRPLEFVRFLWTSLEAMLRHTRSGAILFVFMDWRHADELLQAVRALQLELKNICVWVKHNAGMGSLYRSQHEFVFVFKYGRSRHQNNVELGRHGRSRTNVWNYRGANSFGRDHDADNPFALHPTVKPVAMIADAILDCSKRGNSLLDPFLGSGTAVLAAERTGRRCYGIEIDPLYVDLAIRRWQSITGQDARHIAGGLTFNDIANLGGR
jgi:DNA modification methylase